MAAVAVRVGRMSVLIVDMQDLRTCVMADAAVPEITSFYLVTVSCSGVRLNGFPAYSTNKLRDVSVFEAYSNFSESISNLCYGGLPLT